MKLPKVSVLNTILGANPKYLIPSLEKSYFSDVSEIEDPILSVDIFDLLVAKNFPDLTSAWYGKGKYFYFEFTY